MERLSVYESLLRKWQGSINLVSKSTLDAVWRRHFWDSAQLLELSSEKQLKWADFGSGAGFPGLVLAILARDRAGFQMNLVESDQRKSVFLREVIRETGAPAKVHTSRIEAPETVGAIGRCDALSARACAPLDRLLGWSEPYFGPETTAFFLKGAHVDEELTLARKSWTFRVTSNPSQADPEGCVLKVEQLARV
ncbi:16S rRNA (guanine(527)-N(7))-methyltransferase RsmG [Parvibaculaceae bacterium PLY_AMNH_Bact1]|nr:16S rRNA (guanine(527)-N(7))-methyltransferase RsmG [Parvibaculaceae bacterium PLY_AMNH_Bact1]